LRDGFVFVRDLFPQGEIRRAQEAAEECVYASSFEAWLKRRDAGDEADDTRHQIRFPSGASPLDDLITNDGLLDLLSDCLDSPDARFLNAHVFVRNGQTDGRLAADGLWHIDHNTESYLPPTEDLTRYAYANCHIFLNDVNESTAPMTLLAGSHRSIASRSVAIWARGSMASAGNIAELGDIFETSSAVSATGIAGTVLVYSSYCIHRATRFLDPRAQRVLLTCSMTHPYNVPWRRPAWPYPFTKREDTNRFIAKTTTRMRSALGWPPPGDEYYTPTTLALLRHWYEGLDVSDYVAMLPAPEADDC